MRYSLIQNEHNLITFKGMMLAGISRAAAVTGNKIYMERALQSAKFIQTHLWNNGKLLRAVYAGDNNSISL